MMRFLLHVPKKAWERPERPRREVMVTLDSKTPDGLAPLHFDGTDEDVHAVRNALVHWASGERGAIIESETTPAHLIVAMDGPVMEVFEPKILHGAEILQSPSKALDEGLNQLAELVILLFTETLPTLPSFNDPARATLIERLRWIMRLLEVVCGLPEGSTSRAELLSSRIRKGLENASLDETSRQEVLSESEEFLGMVILEMPQSNQQVIDWLRKLDQWLQSSTGTSLSRLYNDLESTWRVEAV